MSKPDNQNSIVVPTEVLKELLTESEIRMLGNRWYIIKLLEKGFSIRQIARKAKVGTDTVVRISKLTKKESVKEFLNKESLRDSKVYPKNNPWVFGKTTEEV